MLAKKKGNDSGSLQGTSKGVEEVNREFAKDSVLMDLSNDQYSEQHMDLGLSKHDGVASTRAMRDKFEKEYARDDSEEVPDSQPVEEREMNDTVIQNVKNDLVGAQGDVNGLEKDAAVDEYRRRTTRNVGDKYIMDKAKDRKMVKNLEMPEGKRLTSSSYRGTAAV